MPFEADLLNSVWRLPESVLLWWGLSAEGFSRDHGPSRADGKPRQAYVHAKVWCAHMRSKKVGVIMPAMRCKVYMGLVE